MSDKSEALDSEDERRAFKWSWIAMVHGYNELAKAAKTLGERVFLRLARDHALEECRRLGVSFDLQKPGDGEEVLVVREAMPRIAFEERDVEMMRAFLRDRDAEASR